jgi:TetR/AcrR family transcriptional regulator
MAQPHQNFHQYTLKKKSSALKLRAVRDGTLTRAAIIDSAELIFARDGLPGTRTEDIAVGSGVSKAMIHYYFDTKEALYQTVLERVFAEREKGMDFKRLQQLPPAEALQEFIKRLLYQMCRKPHLGTLFVLENMQNAGSYYQRSGGKLYLILIDILERGIADQSFRQMNSLHGAINIMGACVHYFTISVNIRNLSADSHTDDQLLLEHTVWATDFIMHAINPGSSLSKRSRQKKSGTLERLL